MSDISNQIAEIARGGTTSLAEDLVKGAIIAAATWLASWIGLGQLFSNRSFRFRITLTHVLIFVVALIGLYLAIENWLIALFLFVALSTSTLFLVSNLSSVGLLAAFPTTKGGISADRSLHLVKSSLRFLGTGGNKLTDSDEFEGMLDRIKNSSGSLRLLLSNPDNPALSELALQNGNHNLVYQGRVKESIRTIFTKCEAMGLNCEIKLYSLDQIFALPHVRLFFVDDAICIFSQLVWNAAEGGDNPQLVLRKKSALQKSSLYNGYSSYYESLWTAPKTIPVTKALIDSWP